MKKPLIYALCFSILTLIFVSICLAVVVWGQEGCGEWVKVECTGCWPECPIATYCFELIHDCWDKPFIRSVWVPCSDIPTVSDAKVETIYVYQPCDKDTSTGDWYYELKLERIIWFPFYAAEWLGDDMIIRIRLDTLWFVGDSVWIEKPL